MGRVRAPKCDRIISICIGLGCILSIALTFALYLIASRTGR